MPVTAKTSSKLAKLGEISTFSVSTSAVPVDTADSSGAVPTLTATFADGTDTEYLVGENVTVKAPSIGTFTGEVVSRGKSANSNRYDVSADSIMARLNTDIRTYPLSEYLTVSSGWIPVYSLEYWTQQCGLFYTAVEGDVLYYQSGYGHVGVFAKDYSSQLRGTRNIAAGGTQGAMYYRYGRIWTGFGYDYDTLTHSPRASTSRPKSPRAVTALCSV